MTDISEPTTSEPVVVAPAQEPVAPVAPTLPDNTRDRTTEQFQKLLDSNQKLFQEVQALRAERAQAPQSAPQFVPQPQQQPQVPNDPDDFTVIDPLTGEKLINEKKLRDQLTRNASTTQQLQQTIASLKNEIEQREIERNNNEAWAAYPELNPQAENYDREFSTEVRRIAQDALFNPDDYGGRPLSYKQAADLARQKMAPKAPVKSDAELKAELTKAEEEAKKVVKEQSSTDVPAQRGPQTRETMESQDELERLKYRTRYLNDDNALAERLKHTPHILPKDAQQT